ncbi:MAG: hypothetical protein A3J38_01170 [Gammaproteobacteria bacterium RIFCSPHIGHO2_12_FULL_45_9]|nr:MAG: hypothetical protein A3J38_01170 [Gammaproteobacteria bacterium RIFCSPHIGHO2_12_FULL_45_9]
MKFVGRTAELHHLNALYTAEDAKLIVLYGRRRIGKSRLIEQFIQGKKYLRFEGLENMRTKAQLAQFTEDLGAQLNDPVLKHTTFTSWTPILDYLTRFFTQNTEKYVVFLDEFQWLAANQRQLVSLLKKYWDLYWSKQQVMLILCGSVSSYMVRRVISSKALYGRIHWELCLQPLTPQETCQLLHNKRSPDEVLKYACILGGIPKYLNEIDPQKSFSQNMNNLFFKQTSILAHDYGRIFYSQFKEYKTYENIVLFLKDHPKSLEEISQHLKIISGGGVKSYLENLEKALFITSYIPYNKGETSKLKKYKLTDEYLRFYFKYVAPHLKLINTNYTRDLFSQLVEPLWDAWFGFAFENFCMKNALFLAERMGFGDRVIQWGPYFHRGDTDFQIDLIYVRNDHVITVCEIKYHLHPISISIVHEVERKCNLLSPPPGYTLEKALISRFGPDDALRQLNYFHHTLQGSDFFSEN